VRQPTGEYPAQRPGQPPARRQVGEAPGRQFPTGQHTNVRPPDRLEPPAGRGGGGRGRGPGYPPGGNGHAHHHDARLAVTHRTRRIVTWILVPCAIATAVALVLLWPGRPDIPSQGGSGVERAYGEVLRVTTQPCPEEMLPYGEALPCGTAIVRVTEGPSAGQTVEVELPQGPGAPRVSEGDEVVLSYLPDLGNGGAARWDITDKQRGQDLLIMVALCAIAVVAFGRLRGMTALIGLGVSFAVLLLFIIPALLDGSPPLMVAIVGSAAIMFAVLYLTHGFTMHTSVAVLGTLASLVVTGLLGVLFTATTSLTGFASEESLYLWFMNNNVDLRGLLLAGIIIGALGVLDDVTVTQASAVAELARTTTSRPELYRSAVRVGRAHVASAVNTIILAYAGASLPLLLLVVAAGQDVSVLLSSEFLAQEIVRAAVGTIGLVAAVPITTALAALVADLGGNRADDRAEARPDGRPTPVRRPDPDHWVEAVTGRDRG
jgi:uncharacterized membrane protein